MLEVRNVSGRLHVARKERLPDEWDAPIAPYDPYGLGNSFDVITDLITDPEPDLKRVTAPPLVPTDAPLAETDASDE